MLNYSLGALECALYDRFAPTGACRRLYEHLAELELNQQFSVAMRGERVLGNAAFELLRQVREEHSEGAPEALRQLERILPGVVSYTPVDKLCEYDQVQYLRLQRELIAAVALPYLESIEPVNENLRKFEEELPACCMMTEILFPVYGRPAAKRTATASHVGLAQVALALKAYKNKKGRYPESLAQLSEVIEWGDLPEDLFSGQDFIYRREGEGFLVYSIGVNLKDDGGKAEKDWEAGDIVWRCAK